MIHIVAIEIAVLWYLWNKHIRVRKTGHPLTIRKTMDEKKYIEYYSVESKMTQYLFIENDNAEDYADDILDVNVFGEEED